VHKESIKEYTLAQCTMQYGMRGLVITGLGRGLWLLGLIGLWAYVGYMGMGKWHGQMAWYLGFELRARSETHFIRTKNGYGPKRNAYSPYQGPVPQAGRDLLLWLLLGPKPTQQRT